MEVLNTVVNFSTGASTSVTPGTQAMVARKAWRYVVLFQIQHIPNGGHLAVLDAHDVVEQRVEGGGEVVEAAGEVEEDLVDGSEHLEMFEVDVAEPLDVEGGPGHEEEDNNGNCRIVTY